MEGQKKRIVLAVGTGILPVVALGATVFFLELFFGMLLPKGEPLEEFPLPPVQQPHPILGRELSQVDGAHLHRGRSSNGSIWEATYTIKDGRRFTPVADPEGRNRFAAVFGCSFVFGWGCTDEETLPARIGECAPEYMPYNFGEIATASQTMYWKLKTGECRNAIKQDEGIGVYLCPEFHVRRVNLMMPDSVRWAHTLPELKLVDHELQFAGSMGEAHPNTLALHRFLSKSNIVRYTHFSLPLGITDAHWDKLALQIVESHRLFKSQFNNSDLVVVLLGGGDITNMDVLANKLNARGIRTVDAYPSIQRAQLEHQGQPLYLPDGHLTSLAYQFLARYIVKEFGL